MGMAFSGVLIGRRVWLYFDFIGGFMIRCTEYRMGKPRTVTDKPLRRPKPNDPLELGARLVKADGAQARRVLVSEVMGELFYVFGNERKVWKDYLTYEENVNGNKATEQN